MNATVKVILPAPVAAGAATSDGPSEPPATQSRDMRRSRRDVSLRRAARAAREPHEHVLHGVHRPDPYHWMRDRDSPALLAHLVAERDWYDAATRHLGSFVEKLRSEMTDRVPGY